MARKSGKGNVVSGTDWNQKIANPPKGGNTAVCGHYGKKGK